MKNLINCVGFREQRKSSSPIKETIESNSNNVNLANILPKRYNLLLNISKSYNLVINLYKK